MTMMAHLSSILPSLHSSGLFRIIGSSTNDRTWDAPGFMIQSLVDLGLTLHAMVMQAMEDQLNGTDLEKKGRKSRRQCEISTPCIMTLSSFFMRETKRDFDGKIWMRDQEELSDRSLRSPTYLWPSMSYPVKTKH